MSAEINSIFHLNGKVNYNIRQIAELVSEKCKVLTKAHAASMNVSVLPHLSVSEIALIKSLSTNEMNGKTKVPQIQQNELLKLSNLLDIHLKWLKKESVYFEWMVSVVKEHRKLTTDNLNNESLCELVKFISLLHTVMSTLVSKQSSSEHKIYCPAAENAGCTSRFVRTLTGTTTAEHLLKTSITTLNNERENLVEKREEILQELRQLLQSTGSCVQI